MLAQEIICKKNIVINKEKSTIDDFQELLELIQSSKYTVDERKRCSDDLSKLFWVLCVYYQGENEFPNNDTIKHLVEYLNANILCPKKDVYPDKENVFISFLHALLHRQDVYDTTNTYRFMEFYNSLFDVIEHVKWIFSLQDENKERIFPIQKLIEDVANTFELDQEHYLQLVFSLELFNYAELGDGDKGKIKEKMLAIADEYNILLIRLLCEGGRVLFAGNASRNSTLNGTIIVESNKKILIRNPQENYFISVGDELDKYNGKIGTEGKDQDNPDAYYYIYEKNDDEKLVNIRKLLSRKYPTRSRLEAIIYLLKNNKANVFLGDCFWINQNKLEFIKVINPFCDKDDGVITEKGRLAEGSNNFEKIINTLLNEYDECGACAIAERGKYDILTLDYLLAFFKELVQKSTDYLEKMIEYERNDDDYYQNILLKIYFEDALSKGKVYEAIEKYKVFVKDHFCYSNIDSQTLFSTHNKLIFPFKPFLPFEGDIKVLCEELVKNEYVPNTITKKLSIEKSGRVKKKYLIDDNEIQPDHILNLSSCQLDENEIEQGECLYNEDAKNIYLINTKSNGIAQTLERLGEEITNGILDKSKESQYSDVETIISIISNIGFSDKAKNFKRKNLGNVDDATKNIAVYKLLWHFQVWEIEGERYTLFKELILDHYYTEWVLNSTQYSELYFEDLKKDDQDAVMIIAKESDGEGATLRELFDATKDGERGVLRKAFDGNQIASNYKVINGKHLYHEEEINKIVFITDNILSGKSTKEMLMFYLKNSKSNTDKRKYLWEESKIVPQILLSKPQINIEVKTILCTERGREAIETGFQEYNVHVSSVLQIPDDKFKWNEEVEEIVEQLYEPEEERHRRDCIQCIFRPCNMPAENILPSFVKKISLLTGIFQRKEEY